MNLFSINWDCWLTPLVRPRLTWCSSGVGDADVLRDAKHFERYGIATMKGKSVLWAHGASIGEIKCLSYIINKFLDESCCETVLVSYTSPDGLREIRRSLSPRKLSIVTCPLLHVRARVIERVLSVCNLKLCIIAEKDIWPRIITIAQRHSAPLIVVDGHFECFGSSLQRWLRHIWYYLVTKQLKAVCVGTETDYENAKHFKFDDRLFWTGPGKAIDSLDRSKKSGVLRAEYTHTLKLHNRSPVLIAGNMVDNEAAWIAAVCRQFLDSHPRSAVLVAPRHTRKPQVMCIFEREFTRCQLKYSLLSAILEKKGPKCSLLNLDVILIDDMGSLANLYSVADVAVVGGSFLSSGGHNFFEPVAMRVPTICGLEVRNWKGSCERFLRADGIVQSGPNELLSSIENVLSNPTEAEKRCERAYRILGKLAQAAEQNFRIARDIAGL